VLERQIEDFTRRFGRSPRIVARAPGRVNWIGEHTDYNGGLVLPSAIDRDTVAVAAPRSDTRVRIFSREMGEERSFDTTQLRAGGGWVDYAKGVVAALEAEGRGADLHLTSRVPRESGLSSSAALGVCVARALDRCWGLGRSARECAEAAWRAEREFAGVACGIMDPLASALCERGAALLIDCQSQEIETIRVPECRLLVADSGIRRTLRDGRYQARRGECAAALEVARSEGLVPSDASSLRSLPLTSLAALERVAPAPLFRRARHVLTENERVRAMCRAFRKGDLIAVGATLRDGMKSLRDDFEVSIPELDALCEIGDGISGVYGSRLTGAGFGGCTLHLVSPEAASKAAEALAEGFAGRFGRRPEVMMVQLSAGASAAMLDDPAA
jgi:galactokinase